MEPTTGVFRGALPLGGGYAVAATDEGLAIADLRRAKEVILFERYLLMLGNEHSVTQKLMFPERFVFSTDDVQLLRERYDDFAAFGFEYACGDNQVEVTGIPADIAMDDVQELLCDMIDTARDEQLPEADRKERLAAVLARDGAKCASGNYTEGEITAIMEMLSSGGRYNYTHDGRPVWVRLGMDEIRRLFRR